MKKLLTLLLLLIAGVSFSQHVRITQLKDVTVPGANLLQIVKPPSVPLYVRLNVDGSVSTLTASDFLTAIGGGSGGGDMYLANVQSVTGLKTFDKEKLAMLGTSTGKLIFSNALTNGTDYTQIFPARNGTVANLDNTFYIGTTSIALNRGSGALSLTGITSIDGNASTVTNGIYTTSQVTSLAAATDNKDKYLHSNASTGVLEWSTVSGGFTDPMTTRGDIIYRNASNVTDRLALGTTGKVLMSNGTDLGYSASALGTAAYAATGDFLAVGGTAAKATILETTRAIYGNNFDGSAALTQVIASTYGGTGNGFTKFTGATTAEKTYTLPDANATLLYSGGALGTPSSGTLTNCTFPTLNQSTTGSANSLKSPATTGLATLTGMGAGTTRNYTVPDADATLLYSGGALGTPSSGTVTNLTGTASININGTVGATTANTITGTTIQANTGIIPDANDGAYLGTTTAQFSDLFLAEGAVINFDNGDATITQVGDVVTVAGADLKVTTPGTASTSVATIDGTQTLSNKNYEYPNTLSSDHTWSGETITGTAGENLVLGDFVYYKFSDLKWWKAKADTYATARCKGICTATINSGSSGTIFLKGTFRDDSWNWTAAEVWLSAATAGAGTSTQPSTTGNQLQYIGLALSADIIYFNPSNDIGEK